MENKEVRILVVDDEPTMADSVRQNFVEEGYSVDTAATGAAAIELFDQGGHHLAICDLQLPDMDGLEVLRHMKDARPTTEVIVVTGYGSVQKAVEATKAGAFYFVEKPFELVDFGAAVQALLGPWTEAISGDSRGTLRDLNLRDFIPLECVSGATAVLTISAPGDRAGEIHFLGGHICHASALGLNGIDALHEIMRWRNARGAETERAVEGPRTIHGPWLHVFLEALEAAKPVVDELKIPFPPVPSFEEQKPATT